MWTTEQNARRAGKPPGVALADHILQLCPGITHLKLQKLTFYSYGALLAEGLDAQVGVLEFEAWQHGPVCPAVYDQYKGYRAAPLPTPDDVVSFSTVVEERVRDVIAIYGKLSAWQLRQQSHLEAPWERASKLAIKKIDQDELRRHFEKKFARDQVTLPELLTQAWPLSFDSLPQARFESLHQLALALSA